MDGEELLAELSQYLPPEHPDVKVNRQLKHKGWGSCRIGGWNFRNTDGIMNWVLVGMTV